MNKFKVILRKTKLFQHLSDQELDSLYQKISVTHYQPFELIITEGEFGDCLYIIVSGAVRIFTHDEKENEVVLARLESGDYFAEQALLTAKPIRRNASARALNKVEALSISHAAFRQCLEGNKQLKNLLKEHGQQQLITKFIKQLQDHEFNQKKILSLFKDIKRFVKREVFFRQGDQPDKAYYLLSGTVEMRFYDDEQRTKSCIMVNPGQFFGELSVLENTSRTGTAVAITDAKVAAIDAKTLRDLYQENVDINRLIKSQMHCYQVSAIGLVSQYQDEFFGYPAINTTIQKDNGEVIIASRIIGVDIFSIYYPNIKETRKETFQKREDNVREIKLANNKLIGVLSMGQWDDLDEIYHQVYNKPVISSKHLEHFFDSGRLEISFHEPMQREILCECMQIKSQFLQDLILQGMTTIEEISNKTGAGTVCGGCRPRIKELLGTDVWSFVKVVNIREHNASIRSYQLKPLDKKIRAFQAGQHIVVEANIKDRWISRSYTLTSIDADKDYYEITVKREKFGLFSRWLFNQDKFDNRLRISDPQGDFVFYPEEKAPAVCFVAGVGITPVIAFGRKLINAEKKRILYIDYSVHKMENLTFREEISNWPADHSNIFFTIRNTSKEGHINGVTIRDLTTQYSDANFYICGPKGYEKMVVSILNEMGVSSNKIHVERFTHAGDPLELD